MGTDDPMENDPLGVPRILRELAEGRLTDDEADAVVAWLRATEEAAPPGLVTQAVLIGGQAGPGQAQRPTLWRRLVAALVYDNHLQPHAAGARARGSAPPRLLYRAGGVEIDLEVGESATAGRLHLFGHVAASEPDLARAWVTLDGPSGHLEAPVDPLGQFSLDGLTPGAHHLEIGLVRALIEIPDLRLEQHPT